MRSRSFSSGGKKVLSKTGGLKGNIISLLALQGLNYLVPLLSVPYLVRVLGFELFGLIAFAQILSRYCVLFVDYGFNLSATREISLNRNSEHDLGRIFSETYLAKLVLLTGVLFCYMFLLISFDRFRVEITLYLIAFLAPVASLLFPIWYFQGIESLKYVAVVNGAARLAGLGGILLLVKSPDDYQLALLTQNLPAVFAAAISLFYALHRLKGRLIIPKWEGIVRQLKNGWPVFISTAFINLYTTSNAFLLGLIGGEVALGYFSAAEKVVKAIQSLIHPVAQAIYPKISLLASTSRDAAIRLLNKSTLALGALFLVLSTCLCFGAEPILEVLFDSYTGRTLQVLLVLSFIPFILSVATCYATLGLLAFGYTRQWKNILQSTAILNFVFLVVYFQLFPAEIAVALTILSDELFVLIASVVTWRRQIYAGR